MTGPFLPSEQIVHGLTSGVIAVDSDDIIISVNPAACSHLNIDSALVQVGERFSDIEGLAPFTTILDELKEKHESLPRREVIIESSPQSKKEIGVSVSLLTGPDDYNGAIFLFADMTERRRMERAADTNRQLASLGELAAGVVHQLRNPLTIITGRAELMLRGIHDGNYMDSAKAILDEARDLEDSISKFLGFAKPFELHPAQCDVQSVLDRTLQLCRRHADQKGVNLRTHQDGLLTPLHIDKTRTGEAVANIVTNAIDAVEPETGAVEITVRQSSQMTIFEVTDNGPGIHLEEGEDLLAPFFTQKRDGTGLGLSIAQRIVSLQGGYIDYDNHDEGGARFLLYIPNEHGRRP